MKTFAEVLAGGSLSEINAMLAAHTKRTAEIDKARLARETKAATVDELDEWNRLEDEAEQLEAKAVELKRTDDLSKKSAARQKAIKTPVGGVPQPQGNGGDDDGHSSGVPFKSLRYSGVGSLKHIKFGTRQENEEMAYKFYNWYVATANLGNYSASQTKAVQYCQDNGIELKTLNEGTNEQGGALVPPEFDPMLIRLIERYGVIRQYARISPMAYETKTQPRRTGGVTAYWMGEGQTITPSNPTYDNVNLTAKKLAALTVMSTEISEDSAINIADELAFEIGYAFALSEDQAAFNGDASSTYGGITGICPKLKGLSGTIAYIAGLQVATGNLFTEFTLADFNATVGLLPTFGDTNDASWFCHRSFYYGHMQRLEQAAGGVTAREIAEGDRRPRPLFQGYPVTFVQVMPKVDANSQIACLLGDLSLTLTMGDRRRRTLFTDPYSLSNKDQILVRGTERLDLVTHDVGNFSATASLRQAGPCVGLISAAS
jgi:HK97 family phage major capsid protein